MIPLPSRKVTSPRGTSPVSCSPDKRLPAGGNFGYDLLVHVGQALFLRHRRSQEVSDELAARNIRISPSEVEYLASLEARFAEIDIEWVRRQLNNSRKSLEKIPATNKKIIAKPRFPQIITNLFRAGATHTAVV